MNYDTIKLRLLVLKYTLLIGNLLRDTIAIKRVHLSSDNLTEESDI